MKAGKAAWITAPAVMVGLMFAIPSFAQSGASSTSANASVSTDNNPASASGSVSTNNNSGSWAHNAKVDTVHAYHRAKSDVKDVALKARVEAMLHENKFTRGLDVDAHAKHGIVTLTGQVPSESTAHHAEELASRVYGVKEVRSELTIARPARVTTNDPQATGVVHPAYSHVAPVEKAPGN